MYQVIVQGPAGDYIWTLKHEISKREAEDIVELVNPCFAAMQLTGWMRKGVMALAMPEEV